ncbi:MAG: prepilin-type N-terminal cleavage/methylation domain-containing protein [Deltaproteobacteria bacterium]|nr:prepilin-type N-terminal cleavage/methylation domain-containing protein [Deltaproteobacteria bacterium]
MRRSRLGATLIESLIAMAVLAVGTAAIAELVRSITRANERAAFQTRSLEIYQRVASQVRSATCNVFPGNGAPIAASADPGLFTVAGAGWQTAAVGGSVITHIGAFDDSDFPVTAGKPRYVVEYRVTSDTAGVDAYDVLIRIREVSVESSADDLDVFNNLYIRTYPTKKVCTLRSTASSRGGYP